MNVYEAAKQRIEYLFNEFENVLVSFSGGKDSGVMLEMAYDYAKENNMLHKLSMVHMDYEAQYQMTTDYVEETFKRMSDIGRYWLCLPIYAQCACRMDAAYWIPWEKSKKDIWCREMPKYDYVVNEDNMDFEIKKSDFEIPRDFYRSFIEKKGRTVSLVGIRMQESYARQKVIRSMEGTISKYKGNNYIVDNVANDNLYTAYPLYDWKTEDIWIYNAKFGKPYNRLYDLFYRAGQSIDSMRVASPFNDCGIHTLKLYKVIDPNNWGKMIGRVNGVNMAGLYGGTTAMGWKKITLPKGHTWKSYCYFLLSTLEPKLRHHYERILATSIRYWCEEGGFVAEDVVPELKALEGEVEYEDKGKSKRYDNQRVMKFAKYPDDMQTKSFAKLPSYKRMCVCIIKNDYYCTYMGFGKTKEAIEKRKRILEKYKNL
jgi:predicted phosphoadenosine phosphosulfate sulfurtransferase